MTVHANAERRNTTTALTTIGSHSWVRNST
jgi:hypothetical protein